VKRSRFRNAVATAGALVLVGVGGALSAGPSAAAGPPPDAVTVTVLDLTPTTPAYTPTARPLTVKLALTNTTDFTLQQLSINVQRDLPITDANRLEQLMAKPQPIDSNSTVELRRMTINGKLAPHATLTVTFVSSTSSQNDSTVSDLCLCFDGIYPINVTVQAAASAGEYPTQVGFGQTYLPSFQDKPTPAQVSWLWPLIDRPHRLTSDTEFTDDALAASVATGGRLYRALQVVAKAAAAKVRLTLVIDPDLIDELAVMSRGYTVATGGERRMTGTGGPAAQAWLTLLKQLLPDDDVDLTPYADPDVNTLAQAGTSWRPGPFTPAQQARVEAIVGPATSELAWPPTAAVGQSGVAALLKNGASTIVTTDGSFTAGTGHDPRLSALTTLPSSLGATGARVVILDSGVQRLVNAVLTKDKTGTAALPKLASALAVRVAQSPKAGPYIAVAPERHIDADPDLAARAIAATSTTAWSAPISVRQATQSVDPVDLGNIAAGQIIRPELPAALQDTATAAASFATDFTPALSAPGAAALLHGLPAAIQRTQSAGWATDPAAGYRSAAQVRKLVVGWQTSVFIARPANGSYTLASSSSPLFVTVVNTLTVPVRVKVSLTTANGVIGFRADDIGTQEIPAHQRSPLRIPVHVQRPGRFTLFASVTTPDGAPLGTPLTLGIRSTALGAIGVIITVVAGVVLVIALVVRVTRRRRLREQA
jgi:hypothetical protein